MRYHEFKPHPRLRDWVKCFWFLEKDYTPRLPIEPVLPDGCLDLVVHFGADFYAEPSLRLPAAFLIGPLNRPLTWHAAGHSIAYGIRFYPFGVYPFLPVPLRDYAGQVVDIVDLFGAAGSELSDRLAASPFDAALEVLEGFLLTRLRANTADALLVRAASRHLYAQRGATPIAQLAAQVNLSERSLERKSLLTTGFSPKMLARIVRFNHVRNDLMLQPQQNQADLATRYLFFDQAHFIHDFEQFTGLSPSTFAQNVTSGLYQFNK